MKKHLSVLLSSLVLLSALSLQAQTLPAAPVPSQLLTAKTVFLGNAGSNVGASINLFSRIAYDALYRELGSSNHYQLAATPAAAELSLEISINEFVGGTFKGDSTSSASVELAIRDTKTHALLWTLAEGIDGAFREKTAEKNIGNAVVKLAADLKTLTSSGSDTSRFAPSGDGAPTNARSLEEGK